MTTATVQRATDILTRIRATPRWASMSNAATAKSVQSSTIRLECALNATQPKLAELTEALTNLSRSILANDRRSPLLVVLAGPPGTGKTHCLRRLEAWVRGLCWADVQGRWSGLPGVRRISASDYLDLRRSDPRRADAVRSVSLLLLDDVGAEVDRFKRGEHAEALRNLLEERIDRWTVVSTNLPSQRWVSAWDDRVADRFLRNSEIIELWEVPSYAVWLREQKEAQA